VRMLRKQKNLNNAKDEMVNEWGAELIAASRAQACSTSEPCSHACGSCSGRGGCSGGWPRRVCVKQAHMGAPSHSRHKVLRGLALADAAGNTVAETRLCAGCAMAFCFTCSPDAWCSTSGCGRIYCAECERYSLSTCADCSQRFCGNCRGGPGPTDCAQGCGLTRCGCSASSVCARCWSSWDSGAPGHH
jgi:hypothetical protein